MAVFFIFDPFLGYYLLDILNDKREECMEQANYTDSEGGITSTPWWVILLGGIIAIITGLFLLFSPARTTYVLMQILAIYWLAQGIVSLLGALTYKQEHRIWRLISGILSILAGIFILAYPVYGSLIVLNLFVIFIAVWVIISGAAGLYSAIKGEGWGAGIIGIITIILGLLLLANFWAGMLVFPWIFGFFLILGGITAVFFGLRTRT